MGLPFKDEKIENTFLSNYPWFPKVHCFLEGSQASPICRYGKSNVHEDECGAFMEWYWQGKLMDSEKNLF